MEAFPELSPDVRSQSVEPLIYCAPWPLIHLQAKETKVLIFPIMTFPVYPVWNFNYHMKDKKLARCIKVQIT